jgi:hypothetical protein
LYVIFGFAFYFTLEAAQMVKITENRFIIFSIMFGFAIYFPLEAAVN